jgi:hypothetical protein
LDSRLRILLMEHQFHTMAVARLKSAESELEVLKYGTVSWTKM